MTSVSAPMVRTMPWFAMNAPCACDSSPKRGSSDLQKQRRCPLFELDAGLPDDLAPALDVIANVDRELLRRIADRIAAQRILKSLLHFRRAEDSDSLVVNPHDGGPRRAGGREQSIPR